MRERLLEDLLALGIVDLDRERLVGEVGRVRLVVLGVPDPELELHRLLRAVDRAVGDREDLGLVVLRVVIRGYQTLEKPRYASRPESVRAIAIH